MLTRKYTLPVIFILLWLINIGCLLRYAQKVKHIEIWIPFISIFICYGIGYFILKNGYKFKVRHIALLILMSVSAFLIEFSVAALTGGDGVHRAMACFVVYALFAYLIIRNYTEVRFQAILLLLTAHVLLIFTYIILVSKHSGLYPYIFSPFIGVIMGLLIVKLKKARMLATVLCLAFSLAYCYWGYDKYYIMLIGRGEQVNIDASELKDIPMLDVAHNTITLKDMKEDIVILDLWFYRCVPCEEGFPKLEKVYDRYKNDPSVFIATAHYHVEDDPEDFNSFKHLERYSFNKLQLFEESQSGWGVNAFPTLLVFDKKRNLRYKGSMVYDLPLSDNDIDNIINKLKSEN